MFRYLSLSNSYACNVRSILYINDYTCYIALYSIYVISKYKRSSHTWLQLLTVKKHNEFDIIVRFYIVTNFSWISTLVGLTPVTMGPHVTLRMTTISATVGTNTRVKTVGCQNISSLKVSTIQLSLRELDHNVVLRNWIIT